MTWAIGFTGTRHGMSPRQLAAATDLVHWLVRGNEIIVGKDRWIAHHGDCVGADSQFHDIVRPLVGSFVVAHPGQVQAKWQAKREADVVRARRAPMNRNRIIVAESTIMVATPYEDVEQPRGGTWSTIRMARAVDRPLAIVMRDGSIQRERWGNETTVDDVAASCEAEDGQ